MSGNLLEAKFPFLREDVFLIAQVDAITGKQRLVMQKVNPSTGVEEFSDAIDCIHTAVCDIPVGKFADAVAEGDLEEFSLHVRSSEQLREVHLSPDERFKAMCSWVAGIAESGSGALYLQWEIEAYAHLQYPIASRLLRFMARVDLDLIAEYLFFVEGACQHEGVRHEASLVANLIPVLDLIATHSKHVKGLDRIIDIIYDLNPPLDLFLDHENLTPFLAHPRGIKLSQQVPHLQEKYPDVIFDEAPILYLLEIIALAPLPSVHAAAASNYFGYIARDQHVISLGLSRKYRPPMMRLLPHLPALEVLDLSYNQMSPSPRRLRTSPPLKVST